MRLSTKLRLALTLLICSGLVSAREAPTPASPSLTGDTEIATAGFFGLSWRLPRDVSADAASFELQEAASASFGDPRVPYIGPDLATTFTGRSDGTYHFRIREVTAEGQSPWSEVVTVQVQHHPLQRAVIFFALGALVFLATLALVLRGADRNSPA